MPARVQRCLPIALLGCASFVVYYAIFLRDFPLESWWQQARLDYAWLTRYTLGGQLRFLGSFGLLFLLYWWAYLRLRRQPAEAPLWLILIGQSLLSAPLIGIYPVAALDLFDYLLYGRLGVYWGANPLAQPPALYPAEPLVAYSYWPNEPSVYGPLWQLLSERLTLLADGQLLAGLYGFKLLAIAAALATTGLIWLTLRRLNPALAPAGALLYAWNPLQIFETAGNGHNDSLMVACLVLGLLCLAGGVRLLVLPSFTAGLLVKVTLAPLAPVLGLATLLGPGAGRARLRTAALGLLLSAGLAVGLYWPFWEGRASLPFLDRGNWFTASPATLLRELLRTWLEFEAAGRLAALISAGLFAVGLGWLLVRLYRSGLHADRAWLARSAIAACHDTFFLYLVVACLWWQPWYLLVLLALAALSAQRSLAVRANLFCIGGLLSYPVFKYIWSVYQQPWSLDYTRIMALSVLVIFSLPLGHLLLTTFTGPGRATDERLRAGPRPLSDGPAGW
jgi:hypothetical protein